MMDGTRGGYVGGSEAKRYIRCEWVTMGWGLFIDTYIPYLTLHVVDLSISLLPLSLSLSTLLPAPHLSLSLFSRLILSQLTGTFGCFIHALVACERERVCVCRDAGKYQAYNKIFPSSPFFSFGGFNNDDFQKTIPQNGKCEPYESFGAYTAAINLYATPHPENIKV